MRIRVQGLEALRQNGPQHPSFAIPSEKINVAKTLTKPIKEGGRLSGRNLETRPWTPMEPYEQYEKRTPRPFGAHALEGQEVAERVLVVNFARSTILGEPKFTSR